MNSKRPGLSTPSPQLDVMGRIDEVYGDLSSKTVPRTVPPKWRGSLPYLSSMSPAPTYHNLSQVAQTPLSSFPSALCTAE